MDDAEADARAAAQAYIDAGRPQSGPLYDAVVSSGAPPLRDDARAAAQAYIDAGRPQSGPLYDAVVSSAAAYQDAQAFPDTMG